MGILPMPTHKALTKLEPLPRPAAAPSAANGDEPAYKSSCEFDFQRTCICLRGHEENTLPTQLTNFLIQERRATYSFALVDAHEPSIEVVRILYHAAESLVGLPAVLHTAQQPADWFKQPVLFDVELQPGKYGMEQHVRAAFNCCHPMLETYHMTPGILSDLLKQFERVEPKAVIGHFGREPNTGAWIAHNGVALRRDDDGLGVSTASHAAIGVVVLKSAIQKLNRNSTLVMPELATMPAPWLRYELFYRIWSGNCAELPSLLYDAFTCNVMSAKCAIACSLLFLHTGALRDGHVNAVSGPPILWMHGDPLTGKSKTASLLGALFGLKNSGGASTASAIYDRLSQVADAPVVVDDINPKLKYLSEVTRHGHDGMTRTVSGKMTPMRAGLVFTSNGVPDRTEDTAMASRLLLLPFAAQRAADLDTDSAGLLNGASMRALLSSLLQDFDSIRHKGELDAQAIEECTLYLQLAVGGNVLRRAINLWGCALYCMLVLERASQCAAADLARVIDWVVVQAAGEAHATTNDGLLRRFVVALGLVAPFGWGLTNAASQARACSSISYHNAVESVRVDGASCYALQLESVCAAIQQQLNQSFDPNELRQAVRKLKIGDPLQRDFTEGRTQFYDASAGPFPPTERETGRYLTQAEALASCHTWQNCLTVSKELFTDVKAQHQGNPMPTGAWRAVVIDPHGTKRTGSRFSDVSVRYNFYEDAQRQNSLLFRGLGESNYALFCGPTNLYNVEQTDATVAHHTAEWLKAKGRPPTTDLLQPQHLCAQMRKGWDDDPPPCYTWAPRPFQYAGSDDDPSPSEASPSPSRSATPPPPNGPRSPPPSPEEQPPRVRTRYGGEDEDTSDLDNILGETILNIEDFFNQDYETAGNCVTCNCPTLGGAQQCQQCAYP